MTLNSYSKPITQLAPGADLRAHKGLNNCIEGYHPRNRRREKITERLKSARQAQRFFADGDQINTDFRPRRSRLSAISYSRARAYAIDL